MIDDQTFKMYILSKREENIKVVRSLPNVSV